MQRTNRLEEARHNNPRTEEARSLEANGRGEGEDYVWDIDSYNPTLKTGLIIPQGIQREGMEIAAARKSASGQYDPRVDQRRAKEWRIIPPSRLSNRDQHRLQSIDAPFEISVNDITFMERPVEFGIKDKQYAERLASIQRQNARGTNGCVDINGTIMVPTQRIVTEF